MTDSTKPKASTIFEDFLSEASEQRLKRLEKYASRLDNRDLQVAVPLSASSARLKRIVEKKLEEAEDNLRKTFAV